MRGGSWNSGVRDLRVRPAGNDPYCRFGILGFRCSRREALP